MKVIFLDVDGVLNCATTQESFDGFIGVEKKKVRLLKRIVDQTGAKLVLSSTWREGWIAREHEMPSWQTGLFDYLVKELSEEGLTLISKTPHSDPINPHRGQEILKWLKHWGGEPIENFVIIDDETFDLTDTPECMGHIIETSWKKGLKPGAVNMAIQMLNKRRR